ncbi:Spy/CpxP family protein refolding chaperone [Fibrella arboris]|uniref:Spy/CpxP family protein refolding chaperone n=1 Tax=Fibrella arboris TaxID=3242486 RepID=UPI0035224E07
MKHLLFALLLLTTLSVGRALAQSDMQKIESQKIAYITNRLNLTTEQAPQFWAIYNEYNGKKKELNRKVRQLTGENSRQGIAANDAAVLSNLKEVNNAKQKLGDLDDEYMPKFLKVISPTQLQELYKAERSFTRQLLEKLNSNQD